MCCSLVKQKNTLLVLLDTLKGWPLDAGLRRRTSRF